MSNPYNYVAQLPEQLPEGLTVTALPKHKRLHPSIDIHTVTRKHYIDQEEARGYALEYLLGERLKDEHGKVAPPVDETRDALAKDTDKLDATVEAIVDKDEGGFYRTIFCYAVPAVSWFRYMRHTYPDTAVGALALFNTRSGTLPRPDVAKQLYGPEAVPPLHNWNNHLGAVLEEYERYSLLGPLDKNSYLDLTLTIDLEHLATTNPGLLVGVNVEHEATAVYFDPKDHTVIAEAPADTLKGAAKGHLEVVREAPGKRNELGQQRIDYLIENAQPENRWLDPEVTAAVDKITAEIKDLLANRDKSYLTLTKLLEKRRQAVVKEYNTHQELQSRVEVMAQKAEATKERTAFVPSVIEGLPQHMSVLPTGIIEDFGLNLKQRGSNQDYVEILRPERVQALEQRNRQITLELGDEMGLDVNQLLDASRVIFQGRNWLLPLTLVALGDHAYKAGAYENIGRSFRFTVQDFVRTLKPNYRRGKGLSGAFKEGGKDVRPDMYFWPALQVISAMRYNLKDPITGNESYLQGIFHIGQFSEEGRWAELYVNPSLEKYLFSNSDPMVMAINKDAMFSYSGVQLHTAPAFQFELELLARQNAYLRPKDKEIQLKTIGGDGFKLATYAHKAGLYPTAGGRRGNQNLADKTLKLLDLMQSRGVISEYKQQGRSEANPLETKYIVTMGDGYAPVYQLSRARTHLKSSEKNLGNVLAPPPRKPNKRKGAKNGTAN